MLVYAGKNGVLIICSWNYRCHGWKLKIVPLEHKTCCTVLPRSDSRASLNDGDIV